MISYVRFTPLKEATLLYSSCSYSVFLPRLPGDLKLTRNAKDYLYLSQSGCYSLETVDDQEEWQQLQQAFRVVGFDEDECTAIYKLMACILHLGNVQFSGNRARLYFSL
jgi:myosin heavy subunit